MVAPLGNKYAEGLTTSGRPRKYTKNKKGQDELFARIIEYFEYIKGEISEPEYSEEGEILKHAEIIRNPEPPTVTGLSLYLGFSSKTTLYEYAKNEVFANPIKRALTFVEKNYEEALFSKASTGAIFALKNMGWTDKVEVENTNLNTNLNVSVEVTEEETKRINKYLEDKY